VEENLYFTGRMHGVDDKALKSRINAIVDSLSLDRELNTLGKNLSGGFKRRLNLAITVLHEPSVLFLDEPTPGIDPQNRAFLWDYIGHLTENKEYSVLLTDHYLDEAEKVSDQVIIMDNGEIIAEGSVEELKKKFTDGTIVRADLDKNDSNSDRQIKRLKKDLEETEESISFVDHKITFTTKELNKSTSRLFKLINEHKIHLENMVVKDPTLEDVFLILTGKDIRD
jgi:ABC-2 type transport system ATP-binding protein